MLDWGVVHPSGLTEIVDGLKVDVPAVVLHVGGDVVAGLTADFGHDSGGPLRVRVAGGQGLSELLLVVFRPVGGGPEGLVSDEPGGAANAGWDLVVGHRRERAGHLSQVLEGLLGLVPGREFAALEVRVIGVVESVDGLVVVEVGPGFGLVEKGGVSGRVVWPACRCWLRTRITPMSVGG